jgi:hypothetical protein
MKSAPRNRRSCAGVDALPRVFERMLVRLGLRVGFRVGLRVRVSVRVCVRPPAVCHGTTRTRPLAQHGHDPRPPGPWASSGAAGRADRTVRVAGLPVRFECRGK